jgi:hypothetical protein
MNNESIVNQIVRLAQGTKSSTKRHHSDPRYVVIEEGVHENLTAGNSRGLRTLLSEFLSTPLLHAQVYPNPFGQVVVFIPHLT